MRQIVFLTFALIFIIGPVHAHLIGHPSTETDSYQFVAHHEVPDAKLTSGQGATEQTDWTLPIGQMQRLNVIHRMVPIWRRFRLSKGRSHVASTTRQDMLS